MGDPPLPLFARCTSLFHTISLSLSSLFCLLLSIFTSHCFLDFISICVYFYFIFRTFVSLRILYVSTLACPIFPSLIEYVESATTRWLRYRQIQKSIYFIISSFRKFTYILYLLPNFYFSIHFFFHSFIRRLYLYVAVATNNSR